MLKNENVIKRVGMKSSLNPLDLVVHDEKLRELCFKKFTEFTEENMKMITWCKCSIISKVFNNVRNYYAQLEICDCVYLQKKLSSMELKLITKFVPDLIANKAVLIPVKFLTYEINFDNGKQIKTFRTYNVIAFVCDSVYIGTGKKRDSKVPNGALNEQQLKVICMENLDNNSSIKFVDTGKEEASVDDEDSLDNVPNIEAAVASSKEEAAVDDEDSLDNVSNVEAAVASSKEEAAASSKAPSTKK